MEETQQVQNTEKKKQKKNLATFIEEHPKTTFWSRLVAWAMFSCVLPIGFIVYRFDLFKTVSKFQIGGWGIIIIAILAFFAITIIKYIKMAFSSTYSMTSQILSGVCKVIIPLVAFIAILTGVKNSVELLIQALYCVVACELIAIPINPLPKWAYEKQKDVRAEERKETFDYVIDSFFKRKKEEDGK